MTALRHWYSIEDSGVHAGVIIGPNGNYILRNGRGETVYEIQMGPASSPDEDTAQPVPPGICLECGRETRLFANICAMEQAASYWYWLRSRALRIYGKGGPAGRHRGPE